MIDVPLFDGGNKVDLGLYIELLPESELDLRAAARAALAFDALVREVAEGIGLGNDIEINVIKGEQGSFHLKNVIRSLRDRIHLEALAWAIVGLIGGMLTDELQAMIRAKLMGVDHVAITEESIKEIADACMVAIEQRAARQHLAKITESLASDSDVKGVGVTVADQERPSIIRPKSSFGILVEATRPPPVDIVETVTTRKTTKQETVILTEPVLTTSAKRKWRVVREGGREVAATMLDEVFWSKLVAGETGLPMSGGVHLVVQLEVSSEMDEATGVWRDVEFTIHEVENWSPGATQLSWIDRPE